MLLEGVISEMFRDILQLDFMVSKNHFENTSKETKSGLKHWCLRVLPSAPPEATPINACSSVMVPRKGYQVSLVLNLS